MRAPIEKLCRSCAGALPLDATRCTQCGKDLGSDTYQIVSDGTKFGISYKGRVVIYDLDMKNALVVASLLNNYIQD